MGNRILKESICASDSINQLTWFEEAFFYRLIVNCDDYGRMDARPAILRARLFPLKSVTDKQIGDVLNKLARVGIVFVYMYDDKPFLQLTTWEDHQQIRSKRSKYPSPQEPDIICNQMISDDIKCSRNPIQSESNPNPNPNAQERGGDVFEDCNFSEPMQNKIDEWLRYKRERKEQYKPTGLKSLLAQIDGNLKTSTEAEIISLIDQCMASNWKGIAWDKLRARASPNKKTPRALSYPQRRYTEADLKAIGLDFGDE